MIDRMLKLYKVCVYLITVLAIGAIVQFSTSLQYNYKAGIASTIDRVVKLWQCGYTHAVSIIC